MIAYTLQRLFAPLTLAVTNRDRAMVLLRDLDWTLDDQFDLDALAPLSAVHVALTQLSDLITDYEDGQTEIGYVIEQAVLSGQAIYGAIDALRDLTDGDAGLAGLAAPAHTAKFWEDLAVDLPEYLILTYLETYIPILHAAMDFGGVIGSKPRDDGRPPRRTILWDKLGDLFTDPAGQIAETYNWGGPLEHALLMARLRRLLRAAGLQMNRYALPDAIVADRFAGTPPAGATAIGAPILSSIHAKAGGTSTARLDGILMPVPASGSDPTGVLLTLQALGDAAINLALNDDWSVTTTAAVDASGLIGLELQPTGLSIPAGQPNANVEIALSALPQTPFALIGNPDATRIELARFSAAARADISAGTPSFAVEALLDGLSLVIAAGDGDSFLSDILGNVEFAIPLELSMLWTNQDGLRLTGGAGIEVEIPINRKIGPLEVFWIRLGAAASTSGAEISAATAGSLTLGPFTAVIEEVGFKLEVQQNDRLARGDAGALTVLPGFKPPIGVGLDLRSPVVSGGGFLRIQPDEGRYDGIVNLKLLGLEITAITLIATRLPSGDEGWSMYLSLTLELQTGLQLGFGLKLTGLGGLTGINRSIDIEALGNGVRSGSLDAILFPDDPVGNAPMILAALDEIFPPAQGQFVFGPMLQMSWGTPTVVTLELGLAIQMPSPTTISLLGSMHVKIGFAGYDIISIKVDTAGTLWPTEGRLAIDSSITEGIIGPVSLAGDMAVRADVGSSQPSFLVSHGGYHPHFTPPEGFPTLARMSVKIFDEDKLRVGVEAYFSVSSNSLQFGVAAFFFAKAVGLSAEGRFEFDTLILMRPFGLTASLGFQITVSAGSMELLTVRLRGTLKGPSPWFVSGYAEFRALGAKKKFNVELTVGRAASNGPHAIANVFEEVRSALQQSGAWNSVLADAALSSAVQTDVPEGELSVHPAGKVSLSQGIAPIGLTLEKFGDAQVDEDNNYLELTNARLGGATAVTDPMVEWFSPGKFFDLVEDELVSAPSFEELDAGVALGEAAPRFAEPDPYDLVYESKRVDPDIEKMLAQRASGRSGADRGRRGGVLPHLGRFVNPDLSLSLRPKGATPSPHFGVSTFAMAVADPAAPSSAPQLTKSWSKAAEAQRAARASGQSRIILPAYELDLMEP
ncbi:hypothetical protein LGQ03_14610 [Loktanella sp. TSTF-M6]|uniref:DUF6603 domain-containing protein n=1 Tax=Loktanella gaetbuli TaxID=2881335 RepID=A0ABS8BXM6_9RHOB|nr:DUF6603 domain-containing protein [Loktanella gaetbuli]MCB5200478.1 hypothetical protein [Loktanella gaetbuli]